MAPKYHYNHDPSELEATIRERLQLARRAKGLSQDELDRAISEKPGLVRRLENGQARLHLSRIYTIASVLHLDMDDLFRDLEVAHIQPLDRDPKGPSSDEAEAFVKNYNALEKSEHRKKVSDLVRSVANSLAKDRDK